MQRYDYEDLFYESNYRNLKIQVGTSYIDNENIAFESMELTQGIASSDNLKFGEVISSEFKVKLINDRDLLGKTIKVSMVMNNNERTSIRIGTFIVNSCVLDTDGIYTEIVAYDVLHNLSTTDVAAWYQGLTFPISCKDMLESLCEHLGIIYLYEGSDLINGNWQIEKTIDAQSLSASDILQAICEMNGVFPNIDTIGGLRLIKLKKDFTNAKQLTMFYKGEGACQNYVTKPISQVCLKQTSEDVGVTVGTTGNCYTITDNILIYGMTSGDLQTLANNILTVIGGISYRPYAVKTMGNLVWECGDAIKIVASDTLTIESYILKRSLRGIQGLIDNFTAQGNEIYTEDSNSLKTSIKSLKQTTNILYRDNEKTQSIINNMQVGGYNMISNSELLQGMTAIEPIRDESNVWIKDENNIIIYD